MSELYRSWKNIFHTSHRKGWSIDEAMRIARYASYPYFSWNGSVYPVPKEGGDINLSQPLAREESVS